MNQSRFWRISLTITIPSSTTWLARVSTNHACFRRLVVTPDMHRVHHSIVRRETDSNFGFNFPWWDRLFGTYRPQPEPGHQAMTLGIGQFRDSRELRLDRMLTQPLRDDPAECRAGERPADSSTNAS